VEAEDFTARSLFINGSYRGAKNPRIFLALATYRLVRKFLSSRGSLSTGGCPQPNNANFLYALGYSLGI